jgi:DNA-binding transcriptional LysR family regulator
MSAQFSPPHVTADDLLVLLAVSRSGRYTTAARQLGVTHTTVARRIEALELALGARAIVRGSSGWRLTPLGERAAAAAEGVEAALARLDGDDAEVSGVIRLSATDGFSAFIAAPAMAALRRRHPGISLQIVAQTRQASPHRSGVDLEVVVGRPEVRRAQAFRLADYVLGLYASREFLADAGEPRELADLDGAPLVYFIESMLQVDVLDDARHEVPRMVDAVTSTNVFVHVEATRAGAGFGLLPAFRSHRAATAVLARRADRRLPAAARDGVPRRAPRSARRSAARTPGHPGAGRGRTGLSHIPRWASSSDSRLWNSALSRLSTTRPCASR